MTIYTFVTIVLIITILFDAFLALLLFSQRRGGVFTNILILQLLSILMWAMCILFILKQQSIWAANLAYISGLFIAITKYYFVKFFPFKHHDFTWKEYWPMPILFIVGLGAFIPGFYYKSYHVVDGAYIISENGPYASIYMLTLVFFLVYPMVSLFRRIRSKKFDTQTHNQMKVLLWGIGVFFIIGMLSNSILPVLFNIHFFNGIGPIFSLILVVFIVHNIYRYKFLAIQTLIQRGLIYVLLLIFVVILYLLLVNILGLILYSTGHLNYLTAGAITTIIGIFTVPGIDLYLRKHTHGLFFKGQFDYSDTLFELSEILNTTLVYKEIVDATTSKLALIFGASEVHIVLYKDIKITPADLELTFPLVTSNGQIGELQLDSKKSGDEYSLQDIRMLSTFTNQLTVAVERAQLYEAAQNYAHELEQKVADRTSEIKAMQSYQKEMLDEIAHSLQTPITVISNEIELLNYEPQQQQHIESFKKSIKSLSQFIHDLLHLSQLNVREELWKYEYFDLSNTISELLEYSEISLKQPNITFNNQIMSNIFINGDRKRIEEALHSLLSNAVKYRNPQKLQKISTRLLKREQEIIIEVHDTGIGIGEKHLPYIFKRFYRVRDSSNKQVQGSGLGLAIVKTIVKKHMGSIDVKSKKDNYTIFTISLPAEQLF